MTLFLAAAAGTRVCIRPIPKIGRNAVASCEVTTTGCVEAARPVGEEGNGFNYLLDGLNAERVLVAAEALGTGRAALRRAVEYARERVVFGRPIGKNQGVAFPLAEAHARLHAAELVIRKAAWLIDNGQPARRAGERGQVARRRGRLRGRRRGHADPRRLRLRKGVPRRALLAGGAADAHRPDLAGDGAQLPRAARARPAAVVLGRRP